MTIFVTICSLFVIGSLFGWVLELFFRRFCSQHRWVNPGFMVGPYLPIYGFGTVTLYGICNLDFIAYFGIPLWADIIIKLALVCILMTLIEYIGGIVFIKSMGIKLWDYSNQWGNIQGVICPLFSFLWMVVGAGYMFLFHPYLVKYVEWISANTIYDFFIGGVCGMMLVDWCYSFRLGTKVAKIAKENKLAIHYEDFKVAVKSKEPLEEGKEGSKVIMFFRGVELQKEHLDSFINKQKEKLKEIPSKIRKNKNEEPSNKEEK